MTKWLIAYKKDGKWHAYCYVGYFNKLADGLKKLKEFYPEVSEIQIKQVPR